MSSIDATTLRLVVFGGVFLVMACWELLAPRRPLTVSKARRWLSNLGILTIDVVTLRVLMPFAALAAAVYAHAQGWGLLNYLELPLWLAALVAVVALDFFIYVQHRLFHAVPLFWRLHQVHHTDLDFDVTTGVRFHPVEILLSMVIKMGAIFVLGAPLVAVLIFEVLLNATSMFNHSNVRLPERIDRFIRSVIVTPDMHRVHHSVVPRETDSNFGFNLTWWDRLLGTYRAQPAAGHIGMRIGLQGLQDEKVERLGTMLLLPFKTNQAADSTAETPQGRGQL
jgi:sterol desaturase/sphingolipid hydroxylase (fatty acid hydroxylase superfamily)